MTKQSVRIISVSAIMSILLAASACVWFWPRGQDGIIAHHLAPVQRAPARAWVPVAQRTSDHLRVLFIGNSLTAANGGIDVIVQELARSAKIDPMPICDPETPDGWNLSDHLVGNAMLRIREGHWDDVVLQDYSNRPEKDRAGMLDAIRKLDAEIRNAGAKTVLMMTWSLYGEPEKQPIYTEAYQSIGKEIGAEVVPVGLAWQTARQERGDDFLFADAKHPNSNGSYLAGCVIYTWLTGRSPVGLTHDIPTPGLVKSLVNVTDADAAYLQALALKTVSQFKPVDETHIALDVGHGVWLELVRVPSGRFMMGSPESEEGHDDSESPLHEVVIAKAFYMGRFEVTQQQFIEVMGRNQSAFTGDPKLPAECVSYGDVQDFCKKVSQKTGRNVRLPSEAEWEYACRAGTTTPFNTGDALSSDVANMGKKQPAREDKSPRTMVVGSFKANAFGLFDMHGNVAEWCQDRYHNDYTGALADGLAWMSGDNENFVYRGGAWLNDAGSCRSAMRSATNATEMRTSTVGFRVAVDATP